jgi:guanylate cyclase
MARLPRLKRLWESLMSIGAYPGETDAQRGKRRIVVGYMAVGIPPRLFFSAAEFGEGLTAIGAIDLAAALVPAIALAVLGRRSGWYLGIVHVLLLALLLENLVATILLGGLVPSSLLMVFGLMLVVGALIALSSRAAFWWFLAYLSAVVLAVLLPEWIEPRYEVEASAGDIGGVVGFTAIFLYAGMAYFVRQRDRFQAESDELLHNILPDEIATRLKADKAMIADYYESASVLFADVVNFTPMSATLSPPELVGLLNTVFTTLDGFVEELGLEKIKTVGDEYMVASGVPVARPDHAYAIAELALRIRDHVATNDFDGHEISLRIGINSGPVVAGVVGIHKFAYDLWGDVVNTASRMESEGVAGSIQVTPATYELIRDRFDCEPRGVVSVKGKGDMETYLLLSKLANAAAR